MVVINGWRFTMKCLNSILLGLTITMLLPFDVKAIPEDICIPGGIVGTLGGALVGYKLPGFIKECDLGEKLTGAAITAIPAGICAYAFLSRYTPHGRHKRAEKCFGSYLDNIDINLILAKQDMKMTNNNMAKKLFEIRQKINRGIGLLESAIAGIEDGKTEWKTLLTTAQTKVNELAKKEKETRKDKSNLVENDTTKADAEQTKANAQTKIARALQWRVVLSIVKWISSHKSLAAVLTGVSIVVTKKFGIKKTFDYLLKMGTDEKN